MLPGMRWRWLAWLLGMMAGPALAQPLPAVQPKIVVQAVSEAGIDVAAWSRDGRHIWTASGIPHELLLWDVAQGIILDRLRLPAATTAVVDAMTLSDMRLSPDGRQLIITGEVLDTNVETLVGGRRYIVDVATRSVRVVPDAPRPALAAGENFQTRIQKWLDALQAVYGSDADMSREDGLRYLPALPKSPDGRTQMVRDGRAFALKGGDGQLRAMKVTEVLGSIADAELSRDDRRLAVLTMNDEPNGPGGDSSISLQLLDLVTGRMLPRKPVSSDYDRLAWLDNDRVALFAQDNDDDPQDDAADGPAEKLLIVRAATGETLARFDGRCFVTPMPDGRMLGAGEANCRKNVPADTAIQLLDAGGWHKLPGVTLPPGSLVRLLAMSPVGDRFAYALRLADGSHQLLVADLATGETLQGLELEANIVFGLMNFSPDGRQLWVAGDGTMVEWTIDSPGDKPVLRKLPGLVFSPQRMAVAGRRLLVGGPMEERVQAVDLPSGKALPPVEFAGAAAVGMMRSRPVIWSASTTEGIRFWDANSNAILLTVRLLPGARFVAVAPDARYDTNAGPDSELFRWVFSDQPGRSLPPQTLMRNYYEPRLIARLMDCTRARNCATALHPVPPVAALNRQLPDVAVTAVRATEPGRVAVEVVAAETRDPVRGTPSGVYGVKLLMNNRQIVQSPDDPLSAPPADLPAWRAANFTPPDTQDGRRRWTFDIPIPTDGKPIIFSAYSFNADRVKSDTATRDWQPPPQPRRPRRAYVLTIGINDYAEPRLKLNFAVPDAELISQRLAAIPGYEVRRITLASAPGRPVTAGHIASALLILGGTDPDEDKAILRGGGHDGSLLAEATPDDIVIISFSGHGHARPDGTFALLASDVRWGALDAAPDPATVLPADVLTLLLGRIQAGEIAFIIDACHSGAAVNTPDFKPGPMGDPGLGQLAFDKGMRILAATQADDVAIENPNLAHGLLTAALGEGLTATGGPADLDGNRKISLDEWLRYAVARLPSLEAEVRRGGGPILTRGVRLVLRGSAEAPRSQEATLFDFTNAASPVLLRGRP
jgi:hypothetical protein